MRRVRRSGMLVLLGLLALLPGLAQLSPVHAAGITYYVSAYGTDTTCLSGQSPGTPLRTIGFALGCAAADNTTPSSPDTIRVAAGTYDEHDLAVAAYVQIEGVRGQTTVDGQMAGKVLAITYPYRAAIAGLTLTGGVGCSSNRCNGFGGGIENDGTLRLTDSSVTGNTACTGSSCTGDGGGIYTSGALTLINSTVSDNQACAANGCSGFGGGIENNVGIGVPLILIHSVVSRNMACSGSPCYGFGGGLGNGYLALVLNSTFSGNVACTSTSSTCLGRGGGIDNSGTLLLANSTLGGSNAMAGNVACSGSGCGGLGGGLYNDSCVNGQTCQSVILTNDAITYNAAFSGGGSGQGGGIYNNSGVPTLRNDTISNNTPDNCAGTLTC